MTLTAALPWRHALIDRGSERRQQDGFLTSLIASSTGERPLTRRPEPGGVAEYRGTGAERSNDQHASAGAAEESVEESAARSTPLVRVLPIFQGKTLIHQGEPYYLDAGVSEKRLTVYLGRTLEPATLPAGTELLAVALEEELTPEELGAPESARWIGYRQVAMELSQADAQYLIEANAILNWHRVHGHCPRCGTVTEIEASGWVRRCPQDNSEHYPRTDPAIIVAVVGKDGRLLLGGGAGWDADRYSTLAGFVEPGESLEQAVVREIAEEVGVRINRVDYLGSQPWPFPASLMLGFIAYTDDAEATPDGVEVVRARWFDRPGLLSAVSSGEVVISARMSIARSLIEYWYGGRIEDVPPAR